MKRRGWVVGSVAAAAAAAGAGWAWWQSRPAARPLDAKAAAALWSMRFERPEGGELHMAALRGTPLVLNFWATWCAPCIRELPELNRFHRDYEPRGWQVVGLAIDGPTPVREFLRKLPLRFPVGLAGFEGTELTRQLGNLAGALPFTVVFGKDGMPMHRKLGQTSYRELSGWTAAVD